MPENLYILQTFLMGSVLLTLFRNYPRLIQLQIVTWTIGVTAIAWRFGLVDQLNFYSNDQRHYQMVVETLLMERTLLSEAFTFEASKLPFTGLALVFASAGIHPALALKTISLTSLLVLTSDVLRTHKEQTMWRQFQAMFLAGCGGIGIFFSLLALRETMMMLFVYRYATATSAVSRIVSIAVVYLLRPHLAIALVVGELFTTLWCWMSREKRIGQLQTTLFIVGSAVIGSALFSLQLILVYGADDLQIGILGVAYATRIASNFVGLQFLTVYEGTVDLPVSALLILRLVFSETVLIPLVFTIVCLVFAQKMTARHLFILSSFTIYVSIVTKTDFNSFRQNIPFMPLFGFVILDMIRLRRKESRTIQSQRPVGGKSIRGESTSSEGEIKTICTR